MTYGAKQTAMIELAERPGGVTTIECAAALGRPLNHCSGAFSELAKRGIVVRAKVQGHVIRWFRTDKSAAAWIRKTKPIYPISAHRQWVQSPKQGPRRALQPGEVVVPANVKRTVGPTTTFDPRYQVDPRAKVSGAGFSALGPGRYLDE